MSLSDEFSHFNLTKNDIKRLEELFDEEAVKELLPLRRLAEQKYNFSGFDHVNCYNVENYRNNTLNALEQTRKRLSIESMESVIDFYYTLGYSYKRIIYACFEAGFTNFNGRVVFNYINRHSARLKLKRRQLMNELNAAANGVFQQMRATVMVAEKKTLELYLEKIDRIQSELRLIDPIARTGKFNQLNKLLNELQAAVIKMNGIDGLRDAAIEIGKQTKLLETKRKIDGGWLDDALKLQSEEQTREIAGNSRDIAADVMTLD